MPKKKKVEEVVISSPYNLSMYEALREVLEENKIVKGEGFPPGVFLRRVSGMACMMNVNSLTTGQHFFIPAKSYAEMKYRLVRSATKKDLEN